MNKLDLKRIGIFLLFAFAIAWATGLYIYLHGGLANSPQIGGGFTLAVLLLATAYMWAPALANILTRLVTREGWKNTLLRPNLRRGWRYGLICWFLPGILTILGMILFFVLFPQYYDPALGTFRKLLERSLSQSPAGTGQSVLDNLWLVALAEISAGLLISPIVNSIATFGEEFGWRAYLLQKLLPLGTRPALIVSGVIWGIWHWPVILMGYEYGFNYPGFPWSGMLLFLLFTIALGILLGWATLRSGSVWPAVIGHSAINGIAQIFVLFTTGSPNPLLGPAVNGLVGGLPFILVALLILFAPRALAAPGGAQAPAEPTGLPSLVTPPP
ncbi:MAG: CPBP family intramembrane glutamic endopeptidase [Anaerolineae bacterium]